MSSRKAAFAAVMLGAASVAGMAAAPQAEAQGWRRPGLFRPNFNHYARGYGYGQDYPGIGPGILGFAAGVATGAAIAASRPPVYVAPPFYAAPPPVYYAAPPVELPPPPVYYPAPPVLQAPATAPQTTVIQPLSAQQQAVEACLEKNDDVRRTTLQKYGYQADERYLPYCAPGMK